MLLEVFRDHNKKYRELMGKDYVEGTVLRYERTVRYLEEMLLIKCNLKDIPLKDVNNAFILEFEHFVKATKMEKAGFVDRKGGGKYIQYSQTTDFPKFN